LVDQVDDATGFLFCRSGQQGCSGRSSVRNLFFFSIFAMFFELVVLVVRCEIRSVPTAVDRTVSPTKILGFFIMEVPDIELHGI
jgi:hypothetical protein